ncbi:MAG: hypothetical protein Q8Q08_03595 [Candidatus Omnitrophota bacterium]|nr:hypothetical protein [Candidatus Omnitrophota bacterium]
MRSKKTHLVCQHLEKISRSALVNSQEILRKFLKGRHGIYALYKKNHLHYVGLAKNLRGRLHGHLRDRHANNWDRFSVYLTIESDHIRELEALAIRIASPKENRQIGKLKKSQNLKKLFRKMYQQKQRAEMAELFGDENVDTIDSGALSDIAEGRKPVLSGYFTKGQRIKWSYKGKVYRAYIKKSGAIRFRNKIFTSPSSAAKFITKHAADGWFCWKFERAPGDWVPLHELRK